MTFRPTVFFAAAVLAAACPVAAQDATAYETFTAPDGTRFLLVPDASAVRAPLVHWVVVVPTSLDEDPPGALGLSRAVVRAAMAGTWAGSRDAAAEAAALKDLEAVEAEAWDAARPDGAAPAELAARLRAARDRAAALADHDAWRRRLMTAPASDVALREVPGASLLQVSCPTSALPRIAGQLVDWRENTALRGIHERQIEVRAELARLAITPSARLRREVVGTTYLGAAAARGIDGNGSFVSRANALALQARIAHPTRTLHVLTGGFDPAEVRALLGAAFARTALAASPPPAPWRPTEARERRSIVPADGAGGVALAWLVPRGATVVEVEALGEWLAGTPNAFLPRSLRRAGPIEVRTEGPFPADAEPPLLMVEAFCGPDGPSPEALEKLLRDRIAESGGAASNDREFELAGTRILDRLAVAEADPQRLALLLAEQVGAQGRAPAALLEATTAPDSRRLRALAEEIFRGGPCTVVVQTASR